MKVAEHPGEQIKALMKAKGINQKDFAKDSGIGIGTVSDVLKGNRRLTAAFAVSLEEAGIGNAEDWVWQFCRYEVGQERQKRNEKARHSSKTEKTKKK